MGKTADVIRRTQNGKTVFVIAMTSHIETVREQLIAMNVDRENICKAVVLIPHNAMEVDIHDTAMEGEEPK